MPEYNKSKKSSDGRCTRCRECENAENRQYKVKRKEEVKSGTFERKVPNRSYAEDRTEKKCCRCKIVFPLGSFTNDRSSPDGKGAYCPDCRKARDKEKWARHKKASLPEENEADVTAEPEPLAISCLENAGTLGLAASAPGSNPSQTFEDTSFDSGAREVAEPSAP
jgi:hypothetical protein